MFIIDKLGAPLVILLFLVELVLTIQRQREQTVVKDMLANFTIGLCILVVGLLMKGVALGFYAFVYSFSFIKAEASLWLWMAGFLSCDLVLYGFHLLGHKTRLFWAAHITHHSSLHYNISVGFRVNFLHSFYRFLFWGPLCLFGIPPWMILFFESITTLWNILIHTERIKKLGALDLIFNTPSNHRVHHGSNPEYLDKNMGGILIIYDRLFGTYVPETIPPVYGITHNIQTHNPSKILLHEFINVYDRLKSIKGWKGKIRFLFSAPGSEFLVKRQPAGESLPF